MFGFVVETSAVAAPHREISFAEERRSVEMIFPFSIVQQTNPPPTLELFQQTFVLRSGETVYRVPLDLAKPKPRLAMVFRQNRTFAVWDERGLSIRSGKRLYTTKLPELAVTPRLFTKPEITKTLALIASGNRTRTASALSGCRRVGHIAYFVARWEERGGRPWLEALVAVDLAKPEPRPKLLGRFQGFTLAREPIDDKLFAFDRTPGNPVIAAIVRSGADWGSASFSQTANEFAFRSLGSNLIATATLAPTTVAFLERTAYGSTLLGTVDMRKRVRRDVCEDRGAARLLDGASPILEVVNWKGSFKLRNAESGALVDVPPGSTARRTALGVLVWTPTTDPSSATLFDLDRLSSIATWKRPTPTLKGVQWSLSL